MKICHALNRVLGFSLATIFLLYVSANTQMIEDCYQENTECEGNGTQCKANYKGQEKIGECEIQEEQEGEVWFEICGCKFGGSYKNKKRIICHTSDDLSNLPTQATFDYVSGWDRLRDQNDSLLAEFTDLTGSFIVYLDTTEWVDSVRITLINQDYNVPSFDLYGQPTGVNHLSLVSQSDFPSQGMISISTGDGYIEWCTQVVNDIYPQDYPLIFIGKALIHFDPTSANLEILGYSSSLAQDIPTLNEWGLILLALLLLAIGTIAVVRRRKAAEAREM